MDELINSLRICGKIRSADDYCVAFHDGCCEAEPVCMYELMMQAADAIEKLSKKYLKAEVDATNLTGWLAEEHAKHMWIPVTERLPECDLGAEVGNIEWISNGMVHAGCFGRGGKYRDAYFRTWTDAGEGMDAKDADYWWAVTLPEPPKEEE